MHKEPEVLANTGIRALVGLAAGLIIVYFYLVGSGQEAFEKLDLKPFHYILLVGNVLLGVLGAVMTTERKAMAVLIFSLSMPSMAGNLVNKQYAVPPGTNDGKSDYFQGTNDDGRAGLFFDGLIVSPAYAQTLDKATECKEDGFFAQLGKDAGYFVRSIPKVEQQTYAVIVQSGKGQTALEQRANALNKEAETTKFSFYVGCRRPGNAYFPIVATLKANPDKNLDYKSALKLIGRLAESGLAFTDEPYISDYGFRKPLDGN